MPPQAALLAEDATILRMFPPLRACWAWRGEQAIVPITGQNDRRVLFGAINLRTGRRVALRRWKMGKADFQTHLRQLRGRYGRRPLWLLLDKARCQECPSSRQLARELDVTLVWLPKQCPELNPMDHIWREEKRHVSANRQYKTITRHAQKAEQWLLGLSNRQALRKAGVLSPHFWLRAAL